MLRTMKDLVRDEAGFIISAELVMIATVCVLGLVVGLTCLRNAMNAELTDVGCALRSIDQSYYYTGFHGYKYSRCCPTLKAWTAGSTNMKYEVAEFVPTWNVAPQVIDAPREEVITTPCETIAPTPVPLELPCETILPPPMNGVPCELPTPAACAPLTVPGCAPLPPTLCPPYEVQPLRYVPQQPTW